MSSYLILCMYHCCYFVAIKGNRLWIFIQKWNFLKYLGWEELKGSQGDCWVMPGTRQIWKVLVTGTLKKKMCSGSFAGMHQLSHTFDTGIKSAWYCVPRPERRPQIGWAETVWKQPARAASGFHGCRVCVWVCSHQVCIVGEKVPQKGAGARYWLGRGLDAGLPSNDFCAADRDRIMLENASSSVSSITKFSAECT